MEIIENIPNTITIILGKGDYWGIEASILQDSQINNFPQVKDFPNVDRPIAGNGEKEIAVNAVQDSSQLDKNRGSLILDARKVLPNMTTKKVSFNLINLNHKDG